MNGCPSILEENTSMLHEPKKGPTGTSSQRHTASFISHLTCTRAQTHTAKWWDSSEYKTHTYQPYVPITLFTIDLHTTLGKLYIRFFPRLQRRKCARAHVYVCVCRHWFLHVLFMWTQNASHANGSGQMHRQQPRATLTHHQCQ